LKVLSADFVTSAAAGGRTDGIPADGLAQVALAGRSNVGKSTLLNALVRQKLARTSAAPGKTRLANIFRLTLDGGPGGPGRWGLYLVDLPGYGYARGGGDSARELAAVAAAYFASGRGSGLVTRPPPPVAQEGPATGAGEASPASLRQGSGGPPERSDRATLLLIDSRHPGLESDVQAHRWLSTVGARPLVVATKVDKLSRAERLRNLKQLERVLGSAPLPVSATGGEGLDELWRLIAKVARSRDK
jgi:GTP-binding protein